MSGAGLNHGKNAIAARSRLLTAPTTLRTAPARCTPERTDLTGKIRGVPDLEGSSTNRKGFISGQVQYLTPADTGILSFGSDGFGVTFVCTTLR